MYLCIAVGLVVWAYRRCDESPLMPLSVGTIAIPTVFVADLLTGFLLSGWFGMTVMVSLVVAGLVAGLTGLGMLIGRAQRRQARSDR